MVKHNNVVPNAHFHKKWQQSSRGPLKVRVALDQAGKKKSRRVKRAAKAAALAPAAHAPAALSAAAAARLLRVRQRLRGRSLPAGTSSGLERLSWNHHSNLEQWYCGTQRVRRSLWLLARGNAYKGQPVQARGMAW